MDLLFCSNLDCVTQSKAGSLSWTKFLHRAFLPWCFLFFSNSNLIFVQRTIHGQLNVGLSVKTVLSALRECSPRRSILQG